MLSAKESIDLCRCVYDIQEAPYKEGIQTTEHDGVRVEFEVTQCLDVIIGEVTVNDRQSPKLKEELKTYFEESI